MPRLGPPQVWAPLLAGRTRKIKRLEECGVVRALGIPIPWFGGRLHSIEGWRTGELGGNTLPSEPEGWQRAMPCAWGETRSESSGSLRPVALSSPASVGGGVRARSGALALAPRCSAMWSCARSFILDRSGRRAQFQAH